MGIRKRTSWCFVPKCPTNSKKNSDCNFFRFPEETERSNEWVINSGRQDLLQKDVAYRIRNYKICGLHFEFKMYKNLLNNRLKKNAVPTLFGKLSSQTLTMKAESEEPTEFYRLVLPNVVTTSPSSSSINESSSFSAQSPQAPLMLPVRTEQDRAGFSLDSLILKETVE